jgi:hypothetical protein
MKFRSLKPFVTAFALASADIAGAAEGGANTVETAAVHVVGTTPLAGVGVPREQVPANVQSVGAQRLEEGGALHLG